MVRLQIALSTILILAVGATGYRMGSARHRNAGKQLSCPEAPAESLVATLKARVAFLEAQLALLALRVDSSKRTPTARAPSASPANAGATQENDAQTGAEALAQNGDHMATLEALVKKEAPDPVWSPATEQRIREAGSSLEPPMSLDSVRCGHQFCRIQVRHDRDRRSIQQVGRWLERTTQDISGQFVIPGESLG